MSRAVEYSLLVLFLLAVHWVTALPVVDKGVFVITGVKTCGEGKGYCVLGGDCTVDKEFAADPNNGHCDGLRKAFTPRAYFVCCEYVELEGSGKSTTSTTSTTPRNELDVSKEETKEEDDSAPASQETKESSSLESIEKVGVVDDSDESSNGLAEQEAAEDSEDTKSKVSGSTTGGPETASSGVSKVEDSAATSDVPLEVASTSLKPVAPTTPATEHVGVTSISYSEKTEVSVKETVKVHVKECGVKLNKSQSNLRLAPRLASQGNSGMSSTCWTGAIVRSPMAMSMQADPGSFICAGALIHPSVLLTTATCVSRLFSQDLKLFKVALGSGHLLHPLHGPTPDADYQDIKELVIHEEYVVDGHMRINDIALVMLSGSANMSKACTVCLPNADTNFRGQECIVTGYSHPSDSSALESDGILHEAEQRIEYQPRCEMALSNWTSHSFRTEKDLEGLLCASGKYSAEACFSPRDAGSPLACSENGAYVLAGSFSSGFHCGTPDMPVLYTDVTKQIDWVNRNLIKVV